MENLIATDVVALLLKTAKEEPTSDNLSTAAIIVKELECFALAVSQAGPHIH